MSSYNPTAPTPTYSIQRHPNHARLGEPIPVVYGRHIIYPDFWAAPYSEFESNEQYLYQLHVIGQGEYDVEQICLEDTPITSFKEIVYEIIPPGGAVTMLQQRPCEYLTTSFAHFSCFAPSLLLILSLPVELLSQESFPATHIVVLSGTNQQPPVNGAGYGLLIGRFDPTSRSLEYRLSVTGLGETLLRHTSTAADQRQLGTRLMHHLPKWAADRHWRLGKHPGING